MKKILTFVFVALLSSVTVSAQTAHYGPVKASRYGTDAKQFSVERALKAAPSVLSAPAKAAKFSGADGHTDAYGFIIYDNRYRSYTWAKFNTSDPMGYKMIRDYGTAQGADIYQTATFVGDRVFAQRCNLYWQGYWVPRDFGWLDPETTEFQPCFDWVSVDNLFRDMTYDPVSDKIYLVDADDGFMTSSIYIIDPNDPTGIELACKVDEGIVMLTADNGILYGIIPNELGKSNTRLVKINTSSINTDDKTCTVEEIRKAGMNIAIAFEQGNGMPQLYWQNMEIDKTNHRLWWNANTADGKSEMVEVDIKKGNIISREPLSTNPEFIGLCMPYQIAAAEAPSYVRNLKGEAGSAGAPTAKFTWTNPSTNYMNEALNELSGVKIYRDNQLIGTVNTTQVGASVSFDDSEIPSGNHTYKFVTFNSVGDGIYKDLDIFVGRDTPARVENLTLEAEGNNARINWTAPVVGRNGGWIDQPSLKYKVVRYPDGKLMAENITETTFVDNTITKWQGYYYEITPSTADGEGVSAMTDVLPMGPALPLPYTNDMSTINLFNQWKVIDNNYGYGDGTKWEFDGFRKLAFYYGSLNDADDYLVSPKFNFEAGKEYQLRYTYYSSNWVFADTQEEIKEKMHVYYGQQPTAEGLSTLVHDLGEFFTPSGVYLSGKDLFTPQPGEGYVAFKAVSDGGHGIIYLHSISIREYSDNDISVTGFTASSMANATISQQASVEVTNEGKAAVSNYKVEIFNVETGEVLATANGVTVGKDSKVNVPVEWTPAEPGTIKISARAVFEEDTYPADNTWKSNIEVVVADKDGALWFAANQDDSYTDPVLGKMNVGWNGPVHLHYNNSEVQQIFLDSEMRRGVFLKGIQFVYDGNEDMEGYSTDVTISIKNTSLNNFQIETDPTAPEYDPGWGYFDEGSGWTEVYSGPMTFESIRENSLLTIMFDKEYEYNGGNIVVKYVRNDYGVGEYSPAWHFYKYRDGELRRTAFERSNNGPSTGIFASEYATHTRFAYKDNPAGIKSANAANVSVYQSGDNIMLSATCEQVEMYSTSGARVLAAKNVNNFSTRSLAKGVYTLKAKVNGQVVSKKLVVR